MSPKLRLIICNDFAEPQQENPIEDSDTSEISEETKIVPASRGEIQNRSSKLLPALLGVCLALAFGAMAHTVYGPVGMRGETWVYAVIWAMIMTGALISLLQFISDCSACRLMRSLRVPDLSARVCRGCADPVT